MGGVLDMRRAVADGNVNTRLFLGLPEEFPQQFAVADPIQNINPKVPVTCFNGTADRIVRPTGCEGFIAALSSKGGRGQAVLLPGAGHNVYLLAVPEPLLARGPEGDPGLHRRVPVARGN
nr:hypothetical protein [Tsukamurella sp. PLM1]